MTTSPITNTEIRFIHDAKKVTQELKPLVQIGKNGISSGLVDEIKKALKKKKLIKIKCLRYFLESLDTDDSNKVKMKNIATFLRDATSTEIVEIKGFTLTLWKK